MDPLYKIKPVKYLLKSNFRLILACLVIFAFLEGIFFLYLAIPPVDFVKGTVVTIRPGYSLSQTAELLASEKIIKSPLLFRFFVHVLGEQNLIRSGQYLFDEPQSVLRVASRVVQGVQGLDKIKVTFYEGMSSRNMAELLGKKITGFDVQSFLVLAKANEGYLFPETYFFYENAKPEDVLTVMKETFEDKIKQALLQIKAFGKPLEDVIKMASIVERETANATDRKIIAGILWKRLSIGMPLQVDASFFYLLNKESSQLTRADLAVDSPYNLYTHTGLPPTPIANPGLKTILDTVNPVETDYLFYLSDSKGIMHYAVDHEGHVDNKRKYLP